MDQHADLVVAAPFARCTWIRKRPAGQGGRLLPASYTQQEPARAERLPARAKRPRVDVSAATVPATANSSEEDVDAPGAQGDGGSAPASAAADERVDDAPWHLEVPTSTLRRLHRHALQGGPIVQLSRSVVEGWLTVDPLCPALFIDECCRDARRAHDMFGDGIAFLSTWLDEWGGWAALMLGKLDRDRRPHRRKHCSLASAFFNDLAAILEGAPTDPLRYEDVLAERE